MSNIQSVLCPIDFSDTSTHAFEQAMAVAHWYGARVTAFHVYSPMFMPVPALPAPIDRAPDSERQRARDQAIAFVRSKTMAGVTVDILVEVGDPTSAILERAASVPTDLIVMGTHGASGFEHLVLGSVTEKVLRRASCPVLTVPPRAQTTSRLPFKRVVCAVDFSDWSAPAVELASSLARESRAALDLLHVVEWPWDEPPQPVFASVAPQQASALTEYRRYLVTTARDRLESLVPADLRATCPVTARVRHGKPYVEILRVAADQEADMIVMGVHGRKPIELAMFGSTTNQVVRRATCPVLTLRR